MGPVPLHLQAAIPAQLVLYKLDLGLPAWHVIFSEAHVVLLSVFVIHVHLVSSRLAPVLQ